MLQFPNRVLHTDICSPVPTDPTWSKPNLTSSDKTKLFGCGLNIWHCLVKVLQPHLILISVAEDYLNSIQFQKSNWNNVFHTINNKENGTPRKQSYKVKLAKLQICHNSIAHICFGQAAQKPFGSISDPQKLDLGKKLFLAI